MLTANITPTAAHKVLVIKARLTRIRKGILPSKHALSTERSVSRFESTHALLLQGDPKMDDENPVDPTLDELVAQALDFEAQKRLWLRTITPLLQLRSHDSDPSGRVQLAFDLMHIAACEAAGRILSGVCPRAIED